MVQHPGRQWLRPPTVLHLACLPLWSLSDAPEHRELNRPHQRQTAPNLTHSLASFFLTCFIARVSNRRYLCSQGNSSSSIYYRGAILRCGAIIPLNFSSPASLLAVVFFLSPASLLASATDGLCAANAAAASTTRGPSSQQTASAQPTRQQHPLLRGHPQMQPQGVPPRLAWSHGARHQGYGEPSTSGKKQKLISIESSLETLVTLISIAGSKDIAWTHGVVRGVGVLGIQLGANLLNWNLQVKSVVRGGGGGRNRQTHGTRHQRYECISESTLGTYHQMYWVPGALVEDVSHLDNFMQHGGPQGLKALKGAEKRARRSRCST
eukprot:1161361-Pelagomonas_calceolata.AAC.1